MINTTTIVIGVSVILLLIAVIIIVAYKLSKVRKEKDELEEKTSSELRMVQNQLEETNKNWVAEKQTLIEKHLEEMDSLREECKHVIRYTKEEIENREEVLSKMSERELLVKIMLALDGYADKLARIENSSAGVMVDEQTSRAVDEFTEQIGIMKETLTSQLSGMSTDLSTKLSDISDDFSAQLNNTSTEFTTQLDFIAVKVNELISKMEVSVTNSLNAVLNRIDSRLNKVDVITKMDDLLTAVKGVQNYLKTGLDIPDYSERLQQLGCDIQNVLSVVQSTDSTVDTIDRTADKVFEKLGDNWMPVDRRLDDIESLVQEAVDAAERARDAAERARDAVESNS